MAAIYRYGFEGGYFPDGVGVSGSYVSVQGRSGATSQAIKGTGSLPAYVIMDSKQPSNETFLSAQVKIDSINSGNETTLFEFGPSQITYTPSTTTIKLKSNGSVLNSIVQGLPVGIFLPISFHSKLDTSVGRLDLTIDTVSLTYSGDTMQGSTNKFPQYILLGLGCSALVSTIVLDDVAVNNNIAYSNSTGSIGSVDTEAPPFIRASRTYVSSSGPANDWSVLDYYAGASVVQVVNEVVDSYIKANSIDKSTQFSFDPVGSSGYTGFEGANIYFNQFSVSNDVSGAFMYGYLSLPTTGSQNKSVTREMSKISSNNTYTILEKESGGKISVDEFFSSSLFISPKAFINKNYFGDGDLGNVIFTSSNALGDGSDDYQIFSYENLSITSGSIVTLSAKSKGMVIYVRNNCVIEGTLSMDGNGRSGSLPDTGSVFWKNTASFFIMESASLATGSSTIKEQIYQPYTNGTSSLFGIFTNTSGGSSALKGADGFLGGGGGGGNKAAAQGGHGSSSSLWGGGTGGGGAEFNVNGGNAGQYAGPGGLGGSNIGYVGGAGASNPGGSIYLFVGKNLIIGPDARITATGSAGGVGQLNHLDAEPGGGGGAGGGSINIFYGYNYYNLGGTIDVRGGAGGAGLNGGAKGGDGGSGSFQIVKLLTN